ncbi:L-seryl-tRNA(Sec) selenium transferase [Sulfitobacter sp. F26169L]|nr:L-seryl-tRNA(Sec) selenium transferase [Sulfitobacter sp. F26169L]
MPPKLSDLPQIQSLLAQQAVQNVAERYSRAETAQTLRQMIAELRAGIMAGTTADLPDFESAGFAERLTEMIETYRRPSLMPVINATGIIIHTNLGRARLAPKAITAMSGVAAAPSNLELDLDTGKRGSRHEHVENLICELTGAQAAVVVNNCAAAVLLGLLATASGRNVIASRGELIEIGGSYRLPDVIAQSGATLREVGTTNKTRASDYAQEIDGETAVLLKSHTSNFKIVGFTASPTRQELAKLAAAHGVILMEDLGSGVLVDLAPFGLTDEPVVADIIQAGVDLVMFSGDKLLGGPQAGIIAGRRDLVAQLKSHPLMRAVRTDKLSLAALEATLRLYRAPSDPLREIPVLQMLAQPLEEVQRRAHRLIASLHGSGIPDAVVVETIAHVGAGAVPAQELQSCAVSICVDGLSADGLSAALRQNDPPVIGRIAQDRVLLDMRTVTDEEVARVASACARCADR